MNRPYLSVAALVALVVVAVGGFLLVRHINSDPDYVGQVRAACHDAVKDQLKAPTTATFDDDPIQGEFPRYEQLGFVDSENSFGAKIRTIYDCTALHHEDTGFTVSVSFPEH